MLDRAAATHDCYVCLFNCAIGRAGPPFPSSGIGIDSLVDHVDRAVHIGPAPERRAPREELMPVSKDPRDVATCRSFALRAG
jgi:hypothetical protein